MVQVAPIHQSHVYQRIKISGTNFEKGHPRNNPVKLFQNHTCLFREDFFKFLHVCMVQVAPIHQSHVYRRIKISGTNFEKGHPRNNPVKLFQNHTSHFREKEFLRISSCPYGTRSPHSPVPCLSTDQNFANNFLIGSPKEHSCEIISKSDQPFQRRRFFEEFLHVHVVQVAPINQSHVY